MFDVLEDQAGGQWEGEEATCSKGRIVGNEVLEVAGVRVFVGHEKDFGFKVDLTSALFLPCLPYSDLLGPSNA